MRTTLTLEPDIAQEIERIRRDSGVPLKRVVNELIRAGLSSRGAQQRQTEPTYTDPVDCGGFLVPEDAFREIGALLAALDEDEAHAPR